MRGIRLCFSVGFLLCGVTAAAADVKSYCTAFARDEADAAIVNGEIPGTTAADTAKSEEWTARDGKAMDACLALYGQATPESDTAAADVAAVPDPAPLPTKTKAKTRAKQVKPRFIPIAQSPSQDATGIASRAAPSGGARLMPGTASWNDYCAAKYTSFDPATGTYKSYHGTRRKCVVTRK